MRGDLAPPLPSGYGFDMARPSKLKVYRMAVGFHDAYVAAPSQKAAVEAWGSDKDVFARGQAELVDDAALTKEPLASPGKIIKRLRGTAEEQLAALGDGEPTSPARRSSDAKPASRKAKPKPRPSRDKVDAAEAALDQAEQRQRAEMKALREREAALQKERQALEAKQAAERKALQAKLDKARATYDRAIKAWHGQR